MPRDPVPRATASAKARVAYLTVIAVAVVVGLYAPWWVLPGLLLVFVLPQVVPTRRMPTPAADVSPQEDGYLSDVVRRLKADGNTVTTVQLPSGQAIVGYQTAFRLKWFATRLHLFTMVVPAAQVSAATLKRSVEEAIAYAVGRRGVFHMLQGGTAVITAVVGADVSEDARNSALSPPKKRWMVLPVPLLVDSANDAQYMYTGRKLWGAAYTSWLDARVHNVFRRR